MKLLLLLLPLTIWAQTLFIEVDTQGTKEYFEFDSKDKRQILYRFFDYREAVYEATGSRPTMKFVEPSEATSFKTFKIKEL